GWTDYQRHGNKAFIHSCGDTDRAERSNNAATFARHDRARAAETFRRTCNRLNTLFAILLWTRINSPEHRFRRSPNVANVANVNPKRSYRVMFTFTAFTKRTKRNAHVPEQQPLTRSARYLALVVLSVVLVPAGAWAQVLYGSLVGNVTDSNGATIPGAKVEITNVATRDVTTTTTDDRGAYSFNDLQAGVYKVS